MRLPSGALRERRQEIRLLRAEGVRRRDVVRAVRDLKRESLWEKGDSQEMATLLAYELMPDNPRAMFDIIAFIALIEMLMPLIEQLMERCGE